MVPFEQGAQLWDRTVRHGGLSQCLARSTHPLYRPVRVTSPELFSLTMGQTKGSRRKGVGIASSTFWYCSGECDPSPSIALCNRSRQDSAPFSSSAISTLRASGIGQSIIGRCWCCRTHRMWRLPNICGRYQCYRSRRSLEAPLVVAVTLAIP